MSSHLLMFNVTTFNLRMPNRNHIARFILFASLLSLLTAASVSPARAQTFTLTIPGLNHSAIDPGESATGTITLAGSGSPVSLSCQLTSGPAVDPSPPGCQTSPPSVVPPGSASVTINTFASTAPGLYTFLITGTNGSFTQTASVSLTIQPVSEDYTLLVSPTTATPGSVPAGGVATTTVTVSPIGTYANNNPSHVITFSCLSITPTVTLAPVCSFNPPSVTVSPGALLTSTLTLTTTGPALTTRLWNPRIFYAFWLAIPGLGLVGLTTTGSHRRGALGGLLLMLVAAGLLVLPACNSTRTIGTNGNTPANTYTVTVTAADETGAPPSNTTTTGTTTGVTVSLTVTNP